VSCAYLAHVRVRVRAAETVVCRDGHGSGMGIGSAPGEAHEAAAKEAETDATKRALVTFGNAFGLCLYDKVQSGLRRPRKLRVPAPDHWVVRPLKGKSIAFADPVEFCSALRDFITQCASREEVARLWSLNTEMVSMLSTKVPTLRTEKSEHYAEILNCLYRKHYEALAPSALRIDKSRLLISEPRRIRDKSHLRAIAKQPCLVCGRTPSHAHHLKFVQPRALARKPSDEWTVPLCRLHHGPSTKQEMSRFGGPDRKVDPVP